MSSWTKHFFLVAVLISTAAFTKNSTLDNSYIDQEDNYEDNCSSQLQPYDQGYSLDADDLLCAYNASGRIEVKSSWDVYLAGSYLLWQQKEEGLDYATSYPASSQNHIHPANMDFKYKSGFKVSICSKFEHDDWNVLVEYARLHLKNTKDTHAEAGGYLIPTMVYYSQAYNNQASYCKNKASFDYDMIDLKFGRPSYIGSNLILNPFMGARGGWMNQKVKNSALFTSLTERQESPIEAWSHIKNKSWVLGPKAGIDSKWLLNYGFKIYANLSTSLLYQSFKTYFKQINYQDSALLNLNVVNKIGYVTPNMDLGLGLGWGAYFDDHKWHVELNALYDCLYFWNQNMLRFLSDKILRATESKAGNLMLQGLTVSLRFDF